MRKLNKMNGISKLFKGLFVVALFVSLFAAWSCRKEGSLVKREKIDFVTTEETIYIGDAIYYHYDKHVSEQWNWDGNELYRVDYRGDKTYSELFYYDNRNRIRRTSIPAHRIVNEFYYDGRMLERIESYKNDTLFCTTSFVHTDGRMTGMKVRYAYEGKSQMCANDSPLKYLVGKEMSDVLCGSVARSDVSNVEQTAAFTKSGKGNANIEYTFLWQNNNVTRINCFSGDENWIILLEYDDKVNPYNQLFGYNKMNEGIFGFEMLSKNNITAITMPYRFDENQRFTYMYDYEGSFPSRKVLSFSYMALEEVNWQEVVYSHHYIYEYHYKE